jgi:hypothetical protein
MLVALGVAQARLDAKAAELETVEWERDRLLERIRELAPEQE